MSEKFCLSPWHHMNINNKGKIKPCCIFWQAVEPIGEENIFDWYQTAYDEVKKQGINHPGCSVCKLAEEQKIPSRREWRGSLGEGKEGEITYLDITFGNTCNLKCRMCESRNSTKWLSDEKKLVKEGFDLEREIIPKYDMPQYRLDQIVEYCNTKAPENFTLEVKGGEPFVTDQFLEFIDRLSDDFKKKTTLVVFSNGTGISEYYINKLSTFKKIKCNLSVEGTGKIYKYIRGGEKHSLEDAVSFMEHMTKSLPNFVPSVSITVTMYNIFHLQHMVKMMKEYFGDNDYEKAFSSVSYHPRYLDPANLPDRIKRNLIKKYFKDRSLVHVVKYLQKNKRNPEMWEKFKDFTSRLDKIRNEDIFDAEPEFRKIWNEE